MRSDQFRSVDQLRLTWNRDRWHVQSRRRAAGARWRLRIDAAGAVYADVFSDKDKADGPVGRLVDCAAERDSRIRCVDQAGDVPCRTIAGICVVYPGCEGWVLI